jgi:transcriptional regulator with XRE-family HTH domain
MSGEDIKAAREMRRLTQLQVAERLGTDQATVSCWERGTRKPNADWLREIADVLHVKMDSLWPTSRRKSHQR